MNVSFSTEQEELRSSVAKLVQQHAPTSVSSLNDAERVRKLASAVDQTGWRDLRTADDRGHPWASGVDVALVSEELAYGISDVSFLGPTLAAELRRLIGAPPADENETIGLTRDLALLGSSVAIDTAGCNAALALRNESVVQVTLGDSHDSVDLTRRAARLGSPLQELGQLDPVAQARWTALGLVLACADLVGLMRGILDISVSYARDRRQYGVPIGSFQAVQHLLADAAAVLEGSRSLALYAAWSVDEVAPDVALAAAASAKAYCGRAAMRVCETAIQVHAGIGNTWECMAHLFLRRAIFDTDVLGDVGASLDRVLSHHGIGFG